MHLAQAESGFTAIIFVKGLVEFEHQYAILGFLFSISPVVSKMVKLKWFGC